MRRRQRLSAAQRAYRARKWEESMARWREKSHLSDAMAAIEQDFTPSERARAADLLARMKR